MAQHVRDALVKAEGDEPAPDGDEADPRPGPDDTDPPVMQEIRMVEAAMERMEVVMEETGKEARQLRLNN